MTLELAPGEKAALTGPNGAGKSTLVHLLLGCYRPQRRDILLAARSMNERELRSWTQQFAAVSRDPFVFSISLAENIRLGALESTRADVERAARLVGLDDFICHLPEGYGTLVGDSGVRLSAGQRQGLALARISFKTHPWSSWMRHILRLPPKVKPFSPPRWDHVWKEER